jgi:hypothetical protein
MSILSISGVSEFWSLEYTIDITYLESRKARAWPRTTPLRTWTHSMARQLTDTLDDLDLEKKPANPYVILVALALLLGAFAFSLKPVSISMTGEGVYAVQVDIALIGENLVLNECRPSEENQGLDNASVSLTGLPGVSDFSVTQQLPFADAVVIGKACYFEVVFDGVLPTDGTSFEVGIQLPDRTFQETRKLDPQMKIGPIEFNVN